MLYPTSRTLHFLCFDASADEEFSAHYDISNVMFESFLSNDMTYSCAIFGETEGGPEGDLNHVIRKIAPAKGVDELELAQMRKLRTIIERAKISKGDRVLEIGSGWGSLAIEVCPLSSNSTIADRFIGCAIQRLYCRYIDFVR